MSRDSDSQRQPTSPSLAVNPVTSRTWDKMQTEGSSAVSLFDNEVHGRAGPARSEERDAIPQYQPLSARSRPVTGTSAFSSSFERPPSRLGVKRGPAPSTKFVVPPLNLSKVNGAQPAARRPITANSHPADETSGGGHPIYLRNQGLPAVDSQTATFSASESRRAKTPEGGRLLRESSFNVRRSGAGAQQMPLEISHGLAAAPAEAAAAAPGLPRPSSRLGRPLTSMKSIERVPSTSPEIRSLAQGQPSPLLASSKLHYPTSYRPSDHQELLIKAAGWVEKPSPASPPTAAALRPSAQATAAWVSASKSFMLAQGPKGSFVGAARPSSAAAAAKAAAAIIPRLSNYAAARRFLLAPGPVNEPLRCRVLREKSGLLGKTVSYVMLLEEGECLMLTARRHRRANGSACFNIFVAPPAGEPQDAAICAAKLNASFMGTEYVLVGAGVEESAEAGGDGAVAKGSGVTYGYGGETERGGGAEGKVPHEIGAVMYAPNLMGSKGPRKATIVLPKLVSSGESTWELQPAAVDGPLMTKYRHGNTSDCIVLRNRPPKWNVVAGAYCLHFGGRVTHASVKNIQLVADEDPEKNVLQFGRVGNDEFTLDYQFPITPLQAFAIALASLDPKLGCE